MLALASASPGGKLSPLGALPSFCRASSRPWSRNLTSTAEQSRAEQSKQTLGAAGAAQSSAAYSKRFASLRFGGGGRAASLEVMRDGWPLAAGGNALGGYGDSAGDGDGDSDGKVNSNSNSTGDRRGQTRAGVHCGGSWITRDRSQSA